MENNQISKIKETFQKAKLEVTQKIKKVKENSSNNYYSYLTYYGYNTFEDRQFNEIDNLIFATLSYADFSGIVSENEKNKKTIEQVSKEYFEKHTEEEIKELFVSNREGVKLLKELAKTQRFKDVKLFNYLYKGDENSQFSVVTCEINPKLYYVSFEGTDKLLSGWEEDCKMAYNFPVEAHVYAKKYLDRFVLKNVKLIVGGHSKGGNLALVSSMYANYFVKKKIIKIYSNDGQGLRKAQIDSNYYKKIKDRYIHIIPNSSIVGLLLRHDNDYVVVKSNMPGLVSHSPNTWQVSYDHLEKTRLTRFSKVFDDGFTKWLDKYDDEKRKLFVREIFNVFYSNDLKTLQDITLKKELLVRLINTSKTIDPLVKEMAKDLLKVIGKTNLEYPLF